MPLDTTLRDQMLSAVPSLRAFAISLSGNVDRADDLVQETLLRAMYDNVVSEGVPDRFADMLRQLDEQKGAEETSNPEKGVN